MSMEMIREYIDPQLFIVVPMLWGIGMALKKSMLKNQTDQNRDLSSITRITP